jgi:hypothetical protein
MAAQAEKTATEATAAHEHAAPPPAADPAVPRKLAVVAPAKRLNEMQFFEQGTRQNSWIAIAKAGTTIEEVLDRDYFGNVASKLRVPDKIAVIAEDKSFYLEVIVFLVAASWADVRLFGTPIKWDQAGGVPRMESEYDIVYGGLITEWTVVHLKTGRTVKADGTLKTREQAARWVADYVKSQSMKS